MTHSASAPIRLFQFPRMFSVPNLSPFCCKLETWLRIAGIPYEVVDTPNPRNAPKGKLPFIEDGDLRPKSVDAIVFATLAATILTPIESPIRDYLRSQPACVGYVERLRCRFFPELTEGSVARP